jgi:hypothetical protein
MTGEFAIDGVFVPRVLIEFALAFGVSLLLRRMLRWFRLYRFVWHAGLFDTAVFVVLAWTIAKVGAGIAS